MELNSLIKLLNPRTVNGQLNRKITGIAYDSRRVMPGMLFVALKGQNTDGHNYIADAVERGAICG